ncbi:LCP family protein, partial [Corynebacterium heidelbergense]|uniref:LCP family protein n=1 Tax=Corynebacterium heidelbergense TaxID=2055947 RepID=UPI001EE6E736
PAPGYRPDRAQRRGDIPPTRTRRSGRPAPNAAQPRPRPPQYVRSPLPDANSTQRGAPNPPLGADRRSRPDRYREPAGRSRSRSFGRAVAAGTLAAGRRARRFGPLKILGLLLAAVLALIVGMGLWVDSNLQRTDALAQYPERPSSSGTNWLLVGSDSRAGLSDADGSRLTAGELNDSTGRTDTIMLVHIPTGGGKPKMVSFPRDSFVDIPGEGKNKINQAFAIGGPQLLQKTIEQNTSLRVDHYAEIGFGGFANVVDSVGGIDLCLDQPINDPMAGINLPQGCQKMDGPTALGYVRTRYTSANGDLDRVERQRKFLSALSDKISSPGTLLNPFRALPVTNALSKSLTVDKHDHVWSLGWLALAMTRGADQVTVPVAGFEDTFAGNAVLWDEAGAKQLFDSMR